MGEEEKRDQSDIQDPIQNPGGAGSESSGVGVEVKAGTTPGSLNGFGTRAEIDFAKENERMANNQKIADATRGYDWQIRSTQDFIDRMQAPEDEASRLKREKRERSKRVIGAVSDGLRALSNLYFTTQYAPHSYNHERESQYNRTVGAIERAKAERDRNDQAYYNLALKIGDLNNQKARTVREMEAQFERDKLARQAAEDAHRKAEAERALDPYKKRGAMADAEKKESDRDYSRTKAESAPEYFANQNELGRQKVETEKTKQQNYKASASAHNRSNQDVHHFMGKTYYGKTKDYNSDVREGARKFNEEAKKHIKGYDGKKPIYEEGWEPIVIDYEKGIYGDIEERDPSSYAREAEEKLRMMEAASDFNLDDYKMDEPAPLN